VDLRGFTIGCFDDDDFLPPCATIRRAVQETREQLERAGARVVSHWPVSSKEVLATWLAALTSDRGRTMMEALGQDEVADQLKPSTTMLKLPRSLRRSLGGLLSAVGERRLSMLLEVIGEKTITELWALTQRRTDLRLQEFDAWNRGGIDALICPPHVVPAMKHKESGDFALSLGAMFRWTLLNFPAGVVPVTRVRQSETRGYEGGGDRIAKKAASILEGSAGLPVGVQVVARPYQEHKLLRVMAAIEAGVRDGEELPRTPVDPR
jgi:fatty acid amide hydrolase